MVLDACVAHEQNKLIFKVKVISDLVQHSNPDDQ